MQNMTPPTDGELVERITRADERKAIKIEALEKEIEELKKTIKALHAELDHLRNR
jgi:molecular chaperone GrpE (heat shock protein)